MLWITALVLVASAFAGVGAPRLTRAATHAADASGTLTVTGAGSVTTKPDLAQISAGVTTQGRTAQETLRANSVAVAKVIAALKAKGIDSKDLQTDNVSLEPRTDPDGTTVVGYSASNDVTAVVRDVTQTGAVIDAAVAAGANNVSGPSLAKGDQDELYRQALQKAVAQARAKAATLAQAAGVSLGELKAVSEDGVPQPFAGVDRAAAYAADAAPPIEAGSAQVGASVTLVFAVS
jgi:uncharacterized protein